MNLITNKFFFILDNYKKIISCFYWLKNNWSLAARIFTLTTKYYYEIILTAKETINGTRSVRCSH